MKDLCFTSVCFGDPRYLDQQIRLKESILKIYPKANINFYFNELPPGSKSFFDSMYGFKVHAIKESYDKGFDKILWLDPAMVLEKEIDDDILDWPVIAVRDDNKLYNLVSDKCADFYNLSKEKMKLDDWRLVGGSLYYFDFNTIKARGVFEIWKNAEEKGLFGSQYEAASGLIPGHRNDEACMAIAMYLNGCFPQPMEYVGYCTGKNDTFTKKHFK